MSSKKISSSSNGDAGSSLEVLQRFVPEFDPELGPRPRRGEPDDGGHVARGQDMLKAWRLYLQTFEDICHVEKIMDKEQKLRLLLLLAGQKLRGTLSSLGGGGGAGEDRSDYDRALELLCAHFARMRNPRADRFTFLYDSNILPGESVKNWRKRLLKMAKNCDFDRLSDEEAAVLVMARNCSSAALRAQVLAAAGVSAELAFRILEQADQASAGNSAGATNPAEHVSVELSWGAGESDENISENYEEDPNAVDIKMEDDASNSSSNLQSNGLMDVASLLAKQEPLTPEAFEEPDQEKKPKSTCQCPNCLHANATGGPRPRKHNCHILDCGKEYTKSSHLRAHVASHSDVLPFGCNWPGCVKRFYRSDQLARHSRTHTGEKRFACSVCSKAFSRSDHLNKHLRTHAASANAAAVPVDLPLMGHMQQ